MIYTLEEQAGMHITYGKACQSRLNQGGYTTKRYLIDDNLTAMFFNEYIAS